MSPLARLSLFFVLTSSLLAADPVIDPIPANGVAKTFPVGKTLMFPITVTDPHGDPLTYKVTSSNAKILVRAKTGNPVLRMNVSHGGNPVGEMKFQLFRDWAPITAGFIAGFAQAGYYDGLKFHRVVNSFVLQGGDPLGTGQGGPGMTGNNPETAFAFEDEFHPGLTFTGRGQLAMANTGIDEDTYLATNGSQFFVTLEQLRAPTAVHGLNLDFKHTVFGQQLSGFDVTDQLAAVPVGSNNVPSQNVIITSAVVEENNHDAVLVISANGGGTSTITVQVTNQHGGLAKVTFDVSAVADLANSPPFFSSAIAPLAVPKDVQMTFGLPTIDLERDYLFWDHSLLNSGSANASATSGGQIVAIAGKAGYEGPISMGFQVSQFNASTQETEDPVNGMAVQVGIGDKAVRGEPVKVSGNPDVELQDVVVARLHDTDTAGLPANFTAKINWGDGTPVTNGVVVRDPSSPTVSTFIVTGDHSYTEPGFYNIVVTADGSKGADAIVRSEAVIATSAIRAVGENFDNTKALVSNRQLASFTDPASTGKPTDYLATIDWGDGTNSKGTITRAGNGSFLVRGTHTYKDAEAYAFTVRINKKGADPANDVYARGRANLYGFNATPHLPPFPQTRLIMAWNSGPNRSYLSGIKEDFKVADVQLQFQGDFIVINSGSRGSQPTKLRFWLSDDKVLTTTGVGADKRLTVNGVQEMQVGNLQPGAGGQGNFIIKLPKGETGARKYLISEAFYTDSVTDYQKDAKVIYTGPILPSLLLVYQSGSRTTEDGGKVTYKLVLDSPPTAKVTVGFESTNTAEGTVQGFTFADDGSATTSNTTLTFYPDSQHPGAWNKPQTIEVTGVDDSATDGNKLYKIKIKAADSTDLAYKGIGARELNISNQDNE